MDALHLAGRTRRDQLIVFSMALGAILIAAPGVHLFELGLRHGAAVLISHGLAVIGLVMAAREWRRRGRIG